MVGAGIMASMTLLDKQETDLLCDDFKIMMIDDMRWAMGDAWIYLT
jgi:hypothetical protein